MMTILDTIVAQKRLEVEELRQSGFGDETIRTHPSLVEKLKNKNMTIISEIKRASPSKGDLSIHVDVQQQAKSYEQFGAGAISILTDSMFFKGSFQDLTNARKVVNVPLLCKDFMIDELQLQRANSAGADIILLIVAALSPKRLQELYDYAKALGLEAIVEIHNEEELQTALQIHPEIIGINNRNLKTFKVDLQTTEKLASQVKEAGILLISESGIHSRADVLRVKEAGANGILVGEALMKAGSLADMFGVLGV
ncbi:indole-3-glycerol phosphate synthase TrpC [Ectobacillus polymachus]|uniref:indole-3-glycerol phosphate synthase TrpC n=1 Tax=Ectobacillus polymachus TaxID=1508806 RepID=UPI003A8ADBEF